MKLNLGSGNVLLKGWVNIDISPVADFQQDLTQPLKFADNSIDYIYSEHFLEHIEYDQAVNLIKECFRVLKKGGVIRIATPDLTHLVNKYKGNWKDQDWLSHDDYKFIQTKGMMINHAFRGWGHKYLWNKEDLARVFIMAGFNDPTTKYLGISLYDELMCLETRLDSTLIMEGVK